MEQDVLGVVQTEYAVDVSAATPGFGDYQGSTVRANGVPVYESTYQHDALGRITEWAETVDGSSRVQRFDCDDGGRLVSVRDELDAPVADYGYDLNAVAHGSTLVQYAHDALGRRVGRLVNGLFERGWLYKDSLNPIAQVDATGNVEATYVYVTRANVPDYIVAASGDVYRVVADHLGSLRMLVNTTTGASNRCVDPLSSPDESGSTQRLQ